MININELKDIDAISGQMNLISKAGMIWKDLATWIRAYIISTFAGLGDQEAVRQRINKMPMEFGNIFKLFFGDQISNTYTNLLSSYITSIESLIDAQKNADDTAVNGYMEQIHDNIHQRADILSKINPFWQESEWRALFFRYLLLTIDESNAFLSRDYVKSTEIFDTLLSHATIMSDYFLNGLYKYITSSNTEPQIPIQRHHINQF
jgi:hypothetical protein